MAKRAPPGGLCAGKRGTRGRGAGMRKGTVLLGLLALIVLLFGAAFVLSLDAKPTVSAVEKVFPHDRFPR